MKAYLRNAASPTRRIAGYVDEAGVVWPGTGEPLPGRPLGAVSESGEVYRFRRDGAEIFVGYVTEAGEICKEDAELMGGVQVGFLEGQTVRRGNSQESGPKVAFVQIQPASGEKPTPRQIGAAALLLGLLEDIEKCPSCGRTGFIVQKGLRWLCRSCQASGTVAGRR